MLESSLQVQSTNGCFLSFFSVFRGAGACGVAKAIYKQLFPYTWACAAGFNDNNNNNNKNISEVSTYKIIEYFI